MRVSQSDSRPVQGGEVSSTAKTERAAKAHSAKKGGKTDEADSSGDAKADISSRGKEFAQAREVASGAPDVREEKIAELKRRMAAGKYHVDADAIADKMVDEHLMHGMG